MKNKINSSIKILVIGGILGVTIYSCSLADYLGNNGNNNSNNSGYAGKTGALTYLSFLVKTTSPLANDGLNKPKEAVISPDGKNVYVAGFLDDAVVVFNRDSTGTLTYSTAIKKTSSANDGLDGATGIAISPDGQNVYVTGFIDDAVMVFNRNSSGALTYTSVIKDGTSTDGLDGATGVSVSSDGKNVYVTGFNDNAVVVFDRDTSSGSLTYSTAIKKTTTPTTTNDGLGGASGVVVSPDNKNVYVTGQDNDALVVFNRDTSSGALTYTAVIKDGVNTDGLDGAIGIAISPDGKNVYVTGASDDAVVVFNRDTSTGALTYSTAIKKDSTTPITNDGLDRATGIVVSPDNKSVYVTGFGDNSMVVFNRNISTGALSYSTVLKNNVGVVEGISGAWGITVSPDNNNVYTMGYISDAVVSFRRD